MWSAYPVGLFTRSYRIEGHGRVVGQVVLGVWSERGSIELDGRRLSIQREGFWYPKFRLTEGSREVASSHSAGAFRRGHYVVHEDQEYHLDPSSFFRRYYDVTQRGRLLGQIRALGFFTRRARIDLDEELAPELRLFLFWLVGRAWRRAAAGSRPWRLGRVPIS